MLSRALATTCEGVKGYWDPTKKVNHELLCPPRAPYAPDKCDTLGYLSSENRINLLLGSITSFFSVTTSFPENDGRYTCRLLCEGQEIFRLQRPSINFLSRQIEKINIYQDLRDDRRHEYLTQIDDIISFYGSMIQLDQNQRKRTLEFLYVAQQLTILLEMQIKHHCWSPRPNQFSPYICPVIPTPLHSAYPSGHAAEAHSLASIVHSLLYKPQLEGGLTQWSIPFRVAHRIAVNRTIAGVHYPVDSAAGSLLGIVIGSNLIALCSKKPGIRARLDLKETDGPEFQAQVFHPNQDFETSWVKKHSCFDRIEGDPVLHQFWNRVLKEHHVEDQS